MRSASRLFTILAAIVLWTAIAPAQGQVVVLPQPAKPRPLTQEQERALAALRQYALDYVRNLPNYICIQTTRRDVQPAALNSWPYGDEIREQVTFFDHRETYEVQTINGKPAHSGHSALGGNISTGEFGSLLERIFDSDSATVFAYERRTKLRGIPVDVFTYRVSKEHGYTLYSGPERKYVSAWEGLIYADRTNGAVLRIRMECTGIPFSFPIHHLTLTVDYGPAKIADREYILPSAFELLQEADGGITKNRASYRAYCEFEADASFSPEKP